MNRVLQKVEDLKMKIVRKYYKIQVQRKMVLAPRQCPYCEKKTEFDTLYTADRYDFPVHTVRCKECGLVMVNPAPTESFLKSFYGSKQYRGLYLGLTSADDRYTKENALKAKQNALFIEKYVPLPRNANIIDIGSACGDFLLVLKNAHPSYNIFGVEPDANFSENERDAFSGFFSKVEEIPTSQHFDLITMWHVLEHVYNPVSFLTEIKKMLSPEGTLVIEVPDFSRYSHKKSIHFAHLFHFDHTTIAHVAKKAGLEVSTISTEHLNDTLTGMKVVLRPQ